VERSTRTDGKGRSSTGRRGYRQEADDYYKVAGERMFNMFGMKVVKLDPLIYLAEGDLSLGRDEKQVNLTVYHTPGHSPGSICLYWPDKKVLITGDLVFNGSVGRTGLSAAASPPQAEHREGLATGRGVSAPGHSTEMGSIVEGKRRVEQNFRLSSSSSDIHRQRVPRFPIWYHCHRCYIFRGVQRGKIPRSNWKDEV